MTPVSAGAVIAESEESRVDPTLRVAGGPLVVLKFGGTAVGTPARLRRAARRVRAHARRGARIVVVVSATGETTDRIVRWAEAVAPPGRSAAAREIDRALATGEDLAASLLAAALLGIGVRAVSVRGGEAGLVATGGFGAGEIERLTGGRLTSLLEEGIVPVVSGFQAFLPDGETVTLGRGGSDTTAAYLAGALGASACHIITDVDGVYDRDPRTDPSARHLPALSHEALIRLAEDGAQVVHPAAAEHARRSRTPLHVYHFRGELNPLRCSHVRAGARNGERDAEGTPTQPSPEPHTARLSDPYPSHGGNRAPRAPAVRVMRIALAGCGVVGGDLVRLIHTHGAAIERVHGVRLDLVRVLVRDPRKPRSGPVSSALLTEDVATFLRTPADVVVEALGGLDPAERIARETLIRGGRFVTANKALVSAAGSSLAALAWNARTRLDFEAAVGGGVPLVRMLRDARPEIPVHRIRGILNGTTNYILTRIERGVPFARALAEAQRNGFAEADPTRDLDGGDAADKIRILAWLAHGLPPHEIPVRRRGILPAPDRLAADAAAVGGCLRLVAECASAEGSISTSVEPVIVPVGSALARTTAEQNHLSIEFGWSDPITLSGPGAGGLPTAAALLGDILRPCAPVPAPAGGAALPRPDDRPHRWLVSIGSGGGDLLPRLEDAGLSGESVRGGDACERVLVRECGWSRLAAALQPLETNGRRPLATRVDLPESGRPRIRQETLVPAPA